MDSFLQVFSDTSPHWNAQIAVWFALSFGIVFAVAALCGARKFKLAGVMLLYAYVYNVLVTTLLMREPVPYERCTLEINIYKYLFEQENEYQFYYELLNLFLLMPIGWFMPVLLKKHAVLKTTLFGIALTLFIEITQLKTHLGEFQTDDLILNSLGCFIGAVTITAVGAVFKAVRKTAEKHKRQYPRR